MQHLQEHPVKHTSHSISYLKFFNALTLHAEMQEILFFIWREMTVPQHRPSGVDVNPYVNHMIFVICSLQITKIIRIFICKKT